MDLELLQQKIKAIADKNAQAYLNESLAQNNFNLMFRQASAINTGFEILEFLYLHKDEIKLDVNSRGQKSAKSAIDNALEERNLSNILFLLKLKEVEIDLIICAKIKKTFGENFEKKYLLKSYYEIFNEITNIAQELYKSYEIINKQTKLRSESLSLSQTNVFDLNLMNTFLIKIIDETNKTDLNIKKFEQKTKQFFPFSYALEKFSENSSLYRQQRENIVEMETSNHGITDILIESLLGFLKNYMIIVLCTSVHTHLSANEPISAISQVENTKQDSPLIEEKTPLLRTNEEPKSEFENNSRNEHEQALKNQPESELKNEPKNEPKNEEIIPIKTIEKEKIKTPKTFFKPQAQSSKLDRLQNLYDDLSQLKQKGQVKLSSFLDIIKDVSKEVELDIKQTKSGILVSSAQNQFSFHKPHQDKGVDKAAVSSMKELVSEEINHLGGITSPK